MSSRVCSEGEFRAVSVTSFSFCTIFGSFCGYSAGGSLFLPCVGYLHLFGSSSIFSLCPYELFVSPICPTHALSKNTVSFFLQESSLILRFLCWVFAARPIAFVVLRLLPCFSVTGRSPRCLRRLIGDRPQCVLLSFCATLWVVGICDIVCAFVLPICRYFCLTLRRLDFRSFGG